MGKDTKVINSKEIDANLLKSFFIWQICNLKYFKTIIILFVAIKLNILDIDLILF